MAQFLKVFQTIWENFDRGAGEQKGFAIAWYILGVLGFVSQE